MAQLYPSMLPVARQNGGLYRELDVLERLRLSLPDGYDIFHSVGLHTIHEERDHYGEIDVVLLAPSGNLLLMEIKAGDVTLRDGQVYKRYANREHDISRQGKLQLAAMLNALQQAGIHTHLSHCLVVPDYILGADHLVSMPRERIVDASGYERLGSTVRAWLATGKGCSDREALQRFLLNQFRVTPDLGALRAQLRSTVRHLSDGLATWVPRIQAPSGVVRVQATAGSGKTQLSLALLDAACGQRQHAAYVCYNRPLADHVRGIAPAHAQVANFHELCVEHYRRKHGEPNFADPAAFDRMAAAYVADSAAFAPRHDLLIIDEAQDFDADWLQSLCAQLKPDGRLYLLEDEDQRLYERPGFEIGDAVTLQCRDNYRSPGAICDVINGCGLAATTIHSRNPFRGEVPGFHLYRSAPELMAHTAAAVADLLARGFALADIVVLTGRGRSKSQLLASAQIGPYRTRRFTGTYDARGEAVWSDGDLTVESVYRYKGQSAAAVVASEVDFTELTPLERRKLFVALTRAQMAVEIVLSAAAEACLTSALAPPA